MINEGETFSFFYFVCISSKGIYFLRKRVRTIREFDNNIEYGKTVSRNFRSGLPKEVEGCRVMDEIYLFF